MYITAVFFNDNAPAESLTAIAYIKDVSDSATAFVQNSVSMEDIGKGLYRYKFDNIQKSKDYYILIDGSTSLDDDNRYQYQSISVGPNRSVTAL